MRSLRLLSRVLVVGTLVMVASGCPSRSKDPSPEYEEARTRFTKLYGEKLDEAFVDPRIGEIEALLAKVPPDSLDSESARQLQKRIDEGQARMQQARQEVTDALDAADDVPPTFAPAEPTDTVSEVDPNAAAAQTVEDDAGVSDYPRVGMSSSELASRFGQCFRPSQMIEVTGRGMRETWVMKDMQLCRNKYPAFTDSTLVIESAAILAVVPSSAIKTETVTSDAGTRAPSSAADAGDASAR